MWQFEHIEYLWGLLLLIPLAILFIVLLRWKKRDLSKLGNAGFTHGLAANHSNKKFKLKILLIFVAIAASIVGFANLRKPNNNNNTTTNGIDVMIALDVSKSMLSQDEKPTRLDKAETVYSSAFARFTKQQYWFGSFCRRSIFTNAINQRYCCF